MRRLVKALIILSFKFNVTETESKTHRFEPIFFQLSLRFKNESVSDQTNHSLATRSGNSGRLQQVNER